MSTDDTRPDPDETDPHSDPDEKTVDPHRAASFARLVDGLLDGAAIPPALDASDRALLETATLIQSLGQDALLEPERSKWIVDRALEEALLGTSDAHSSKLATLDLGTLEGAEAGGSNEAVPEEIEPERTDVIRLSTRRADRVLRTIPWVVASVAVAAAILLFVTRPSADEQAKQATETAGAQRIASANEVQRHPHHFSRPTDRLVGEISADAAGNASARLDAIYSNRLASFREIRYRDIKLAGSSSGKQGRVQ